MDRKEEIILATLSLASEKGLAGVSMSMIAEKIGIKKASLYKHFSSKEEIIENMYLYLREKSKKKALVSSFNMSELLKEKSAYEILKIALNNYLNITGDMLTFYKVIYSERCVNKTAANILLEETNKMVEATKQMFLVFNQTGHLHIDDVENCSLSFALTIHGLIDYELDQRFAKNIFDENHGKIDNYLKWFCKKNG